MPNQLVHPKLMQHLGRSHSGSSVSVGSAVITYDSSNEPTVSFSEDPLMRAISAYIEPVNSVGMGGQQIRRPDQTIVQNGYNILLYGYYPRITVDDQLTDDQGRIFDIITVGHDDFNSHTTLLCERINPTPNES